MRIGRRQIQSGYKPSASLDFNFGESTFLDSRITFTRASSATYFNSSGVLTTASSNTPRFDYDPSTLRPKGLLVEEQRTNLLMYSEQFDNAAWTKFGLLAFGSGSISNAISAPDGATSAELIVEDTSTGSHGFQTLYAITVGATYTATIYAKAKERTGIQLNLISSPQAGSCFAAFDLSAGTAGSTLPSGDLTSPTSSIQAVGNGWYRLRLTVATTTAQNLFLQVRIASGATTNYTGDGTSGLYLWGAQLEAGSFATSYIPTTSAQVTRAADVGTVSTLTPWFNASEGTLFVEQTFGGALIGSAVASNVISFNDGTTSNSFSLRTVIDPTNPQADARIVTGGVTQMDTSGLQPVVAGTSYKRALGYKGNDSVQAYNGTTPASEQDTSCTIPTVTTLSFPHTAAATGVCMWIKRLAYYPRRLTNAELQALTT